MDQIDPLEYVSHPVNAFNLLKRAATLVPELMKKEKEKGGGVSPVGKLLSALSLSDRGDFLDGATFGILNMQFAHQLDPREIMAGKDRH